MNTKERREELEFASRLRGIAKGKPVHARNCRATAEINWQRAKEIHIPDTDFGEALADFLVSPERRAKRYAERADYEEAARNAEAEAEKVEAAADAADAEADRAEMRAIGGG